MIFGAIMYDLILNKLKIVVALAIKADLCVGVHTLKQLPSTTLFNNSFCNPLHI